MPTPQHSTTKGTDLAGGDPAGDSPDDSNFQRSIDSRQMIFLALAGGIGAGLFVASGSALSAGGPASALVNYAVVGMMVCTTMGALGELASKSHTLHLPCHYLCPLTLPPRALSAL